MSQRTFEKLAISALAALNLFLISALPNAAAEYDWPTRFEQFRPDRVDSKSLTELWNNRPHTMSQAAVTVQLQLNDDGTISRYAQPFIYQSSGSRDLDDYAIQCLQRAAPFYISPVIKTIFKRHGNVCLAVLDTAAVPRNAYLKTKYDSNYFLFAEALQNKIRPVWLKFESKKTYKVQCKFISLKDGGIENAEVIQTSGDKKIDQACLAAITAALPLTNIVKSAPDRLTTLVVFDYDKKRKVHTSEVWVDNTLRSQESDSWDGQDVDNNIGHAKTSVIKFTHFEDPQFREELDNKTYMASVARRIKSHWLPGSPREKYSVVCRFKIGTQGQLLSREIIKSGGCAEVDAPCLNALTKAAPFAPPPRNWRKGTSIEFTFEHTDNFGSGGIMSMPGVATGSQTRVKADPVPDYMAPYLVQLQGLIESKWRREPEFRQEESIVLDINKDGTVKNFYLKFVTGKNDQDRAIIEAVKAAQPFPPLPQEAGESYSATIKFSPQPVPQAQVRQPVTEK